MDEVEALADRVAVLLGQEIVASGTPTSIGGRVLGTVTIQFRLPEGVPGESLPVPQTQRGWPRGAQPTTKSECCTSSRGGRSTAATLAGPVGARVSLEDIYLGLSRPWCPAGRGMERGAVMTTPRHPSADCSGVNDVPLVGHQVGYEQLSFWLNPVGAVLTIGFSLVFLVIFLSTSRHSTVNWVPVNLGQYYVPGLSHTG